jgi:hypothetical protein
MGMVEMMVHCPQEIVHQAALGEVIQEQTVAVAVPTAQLRWLAVTPIPTATVGQEGEEGAQA